MISSPSYSENSASKALVTKTPDSISFPLLSNAVDKQLQLLEVSVQRVLDLCQKYCDTIESTNSIPDGLKTDLSVLESENSVPIQNTIKLINNNIKDIEKYRSPPLEIDLNYEGRRSILYGDDKEASRLEFAEMSKAIAGYAASYKSMLDSLSATADHWKNAQNAHIKILSIQQSLANKTASMPPQFSKAVSGFDVAILPFADALKRKVDAEQILLEHFEFKTAEMHKNLDPILPWVPAIIKGAQGNRALAVVTIPLDVKSHLIQASELIELGEGINIPSNSAFNIQQALIKMKKQNGIVRAESERLWREAKITDAKAALTTLDIVEEGIKNSVRELEKNLRDIRDIAKSAAEEAIKLEKKIRDESLNESVKLTKKGIKESINAVEDTFETIKTGEVQGDVGKAVTKAGEDVFRAWVKFNTDTIEEVGRAGEKVVELVDAVGHFIEDEFHSSLQTLSDAEKRVREGKIADALWHTAVDPAKGTSSNAATAVTNSSYLNAIAATAASVYGGPAGAAAYAAWLTYEQTGDLELALKNGIIAGATSYASSGVAEVPSDIKRVVASGVLGGVAVAANGGSEEDILKGFYTSAGVAVVQIGYREYTGAEFDPSPSEGDAFCKASPGADCAPHTENMRDFTPAEIKRPQVGVMAEAGETGITLETSSTMTTISRVPGMNAMAYGHDIFALDVSTVIDDSTLGFEVVNKSTIIPAMIIAYTAAGAPTYTLLQEVSVNKFRENEADPSGAPIIE